MFTDYPSPYSKNKNPSEGQKYTANKVKTLLDYHYISLLQQQQISINLDSDIHSDLPFPLLDNCVNLAGDPISRKEALTEALSHPFDGDAETDHNWVSGFKLAEERDSNSVSFVGTTSQPIQDKLYKLEYWIPYRIWQQIPTAPLNEHPDSQLDCLGYRPNTNWFPYKPWFDSAHLTLCRAVPIPVSQHILSFRI